MTEFYNPPTLTGYDQSPPEDDGSQVATNLVQWSTHTDKLGDPLKVFSEAINDELVSTFSSVSSLAVNKAELSAINAGESPSGSIYMQGRTIAGDGGQGFFVETQANISTQVTSDPQGGIYVPFGSDPTGASGGFIRQFAGPYLLEWFGAIGDNSTLNDTAISAAKDYVITQGGGQILLLSDSTYLISATVAIDGIGVRFIGQGPSSIIKANAATFNQFTLTDADDTTFHNMRFEGAATTDATNQYAIFTVTGNPSKRVKVTRCQFGGPDASTSLNNAVVFDRDCDDCEFEFNLVDLMFGASQSDTGYGILMGSNKGNKVLFNYFISATGRGRHGAYASIGTSKFLIQGNNFEAYNSAAIAIQATAAQDGCFDGDVCENYIATSNNLFSLDGAIAILGNINRVKLHHNTIIDSVGRSIFVNGSFSGSGQAADIEVSDNIIKGGTSGLDIRGVLRPILRDNNVIDPSSTHYTIQKDSSLAQTCVDPFISGNKSEGTTPSSAFRIDPTAPAPTGTVLKGNDFIKAATNAIDLNGIQTSIDGKIYFTVTHDFPSAAANTGISQAFNIPGIVTTDVATVQTKSMLAGITFYAQVSAADTVTVFLTNATVGALDLGNTDFTIIVDVGGQDVAL